MWLKGDIGRAGSPGCGFRPHLLLCDPRQPRSLSVENSPHWLLRRGVEFTQVRDSDQDPARAGGACVCPCVGVCVLLPVLAQGIAHCGRHMQGPRSQKPSPVCPVSCSLLCSYPSDCANAHLLAGNQSSVRPTSETLVKVVLPALRRLGVPGANPRALGWAPVRRGGVRAGRGRGGQVDLDQSRGHVALHQAC